MTPQQVQDLVDKTAKATVKELLADENRCVYTISPEEHNRHHELIDEALSVLKHVNEIKWAFLKTVVILAGVGLLALMGINLKGGGPHP